MDALGNLPLANSINISALKKAMQTRESMMNTILESSSGGKSSLQSNISSGAKEMVVQTTNKGASLDLSA